SWNLASAMSSLLFVLVAVLIGVAVWLLYRIWQRRNRSEDIEAQAVPAVPDLSDENVGAEQLPEDGWTRLAHELMEKGELRLALRGACLATLGDVVWAKRRGLRASLVRLARSHDGYGLPFLPQCGKDAIRCMKRLPLIL